MRIVNLPLEHHLGDAVDMESDIWHWFAECVVYAFNRYTVGDHGASPCKGIKGREPNAPSAAFGENVFYHARKAAGDTDKVDSPGSDGLCLGTLWMGNGYVIGTPFGTMKAHSINRLPEDDCWDAGLVNTMDGPPCRPVLGRFVRRLFAHMIRSNDVEFDDQREASFPPATGDDEFEGIPFVEPSQIKTRAFRVMRADVLNYGATDRCSGRRGMERDREDAHWVPHRFSLRCRIV